MSAGAILKPTGIDRPLGRDAKPGDLQGPENPPWKACRRCGTPCSPQGHPNGCPRTPGYTQIAGLPLRSCYCGQIVVLAPDWLGQCCADTPPVRLPEGCAVCGSDLCKVSDPADEPVQSGRGGWWQHSRCAGAKRHGGAR